MAIMRVLGNEGFVEGIVGSSTRPFKVIHREISFQLSYFRFHLLRVRFTLMSCQRFLGQYELVQRVGDVEIGRVLLQLRIRNTIWEKSEKGLTSGTNGGSSCFASSFAQLICENQGWDRISSMLEVPVLQPNLFFGSRSRS